MPSLRERHAERTREAIVTAAYELFASKGYAETTIDEIAERADVAPRTFFRYFPAKEALLFDGSTDQIGHAVSLLRARPTDESPYESLIAVLRATASEFTQGEQRERMLAKFAAENDRLFEHHRAVVMCEFEEKVSDVLAERAGPSADRLAIDAAAGALLSTFGTAIRAWLRDGAKGPVEPYLDRCIDGAQGVFESSTTTTTRP